MPQLYIADHADKVLEEVQLLVSNVRAVSFAVRSMKADDSRKALIRSVVSTAQKNVDKINLLVNELDAKLHKHDLV